MDNRRTDTHPAEPRCILHVDMDAFFASVEQRDRPELRDRPVLVGGVGARGVVAAASYEARAFGVRSAMPMGEARRRCPEAVVLAARHGRYAEVSREVFAIFRRYTPLVEGLSLDEAFLDVTASRALFGDGEAIARAIKQTIADELGLRASAGVAPNKFLAKIASDLDKPNGLVVVDAARIAAFLHPLPIERMWGVGPKAAARLHAADLRTLGDLARADPAHLRALLGAWGETVSALARGKDERPVEAEREAKSVGGEETFENDISECVELERRLLRQCARVAARLSQQHLRGSCVSVKIKTADFKTRTRQRRLPQSVYDTDTLYAAARDLLGRFNLGPTPLRLIGVSVSDLRAGAQGELFTDAQQRKREVVEEVSNAIRERFGSTGITRADLQKP